MKLFYSLLSICIFVDTYIDTEIPHGEPLIKFKVNVCSLKCESALHAYKSLLQNKFLRLLPYHRESTGSRPITEVKSDRAGLVTWMGDRLGIPSAVDSILFCILQLRRTRIVLHCDVCLCIDYVTKESHSIARANLFLGLLAICYDI